MYSCQCCCTFTGMLLHMWVELKWWLLLQLVWKQVLEIKCTHLHTGSGSKVLSALLHSKWTLHPLQLSVLHVTLTCFSSVLPTCSAVQWALNRWSLVTGNGEIICTKARSRCKHFNSLLTWVHMMTDYWFVWSDCTPVMCLLTDNK